MNKRALLISFIIGFIGFLLSDTFYFQYIGSIWSLPLPEKPLLVGISAFLISALLFHIKPELMGNLNKPNKEDDNNEDKE